MSHFTVVFVIHACQHIWVHGDAPRTFFEPATFISTRFRVSVQRQEPQDGCGDRSEIRRGKFSLYMLTRYQRNATLAQRYSLRRADRMRRCVGGVATRALYIWS